MLRSYQYTEKSYLDYSMQDDAFQMKEIDIARHYVDPKIPMNYTQVCNKVSANKQYIIDILNKKQTIQSIHTS